MANDSSSYAVPTETIPSLDPAHQLQDLMEIREFFESRGIGTRNTRIERYYNYLEQLIRDGSKSVDPETIFKNSIAEQFRSPGDWTLYVLREIHELTWILKGLKVHVPKGVDEKLRLIVGGRDFAALDVDSHSRNAQFELRIASYFCQSSCNVDMSTETDIVATANRYVFYIECKRVGSKNKLGMRLSEARRQLTRRMPRRGFRRRPLGCIAVDVSRVAFSHNGLTWGITNEHSRDVIQKKLVEVTNKCEHHLSFESCPNLLCYWLQIHIPTLIMQPSPGALASRFSSYHVPRPLLNRKDSNVLTAFYRLLESVSKYDSRATPARSLTLRESVNFPAGTRFGLEQDRIIELLEKEELSEAEQAEIVGSLVIDDIEEKFCFFEVGLLPSELIGEWKQETMADRAMGAFVLLASLYQRRYPYEDSERVPRLGSLTVPATSDS